MQRKAEKGGMHKTHDEESQETNLKTRVTKERHAMESFTLLTQSPLLMSWPWLRNV